MDIRERDGSLHPENADDGWDYYHNPPAEGDCRKLVTLEQGGMMWVGIRAWDGKRWLNNNEPEPAKVVAWRNLPKPAAGYWSRGKFYLPSPAES